MVELERIYGDLANSFRAIFALSRPNKLLVDVATEPDLLGDAVGDS